MASPASRPCQCEGTGEPTLDIDFPPGSDIMGEIMEGPKAAERMEFELLNRFASHREVGL